MASQEIICRRNVPKSFYDQLYYATRDNKCARFELVNPQRVDELFVKRPSYHYVTRVAIERWYKSLSEEVDFVYFLNVCAQYDLSKVEKISHNAFNWSREEFMKRRQMKDCIWADVVFRKSTETCLTKQKTKVDLKELKKFIDLLYRTIKDVVFYDKAVDLEWQLFGPLRDAENYSLIPGGLDQERALLISKLANLRERIVAENVVGVLKLQQAKILTAEDVMMNAHIWDPIEIRFELNWYNSIVNQYQYEVDIDQFHITTDTRNMTVKTVNEKACSAGVLDSYYSDAEEYKRRINDLQERLDTEVEDLENTTSYIQGKIDRLRDTQRSLRKEIQRFHREIEARLALEERWRAAEEEKRLAKLAAVLAQQEAARLQKLEQERLERLRKKARNK